MKSELIHPSIGISSDEHILQSANENNLAIMGNLQVAFDMTEDDLAALLNGEHFNHQY